MKSILVKSIFCEGKIDHIMNVRTEHMKNHNEDSYMQGIIDCLPTLLGYMSIGIAFGVVGMALDLSVLEVALLSILVYGGSSQFIIYALIVAHTSFYIIILTTFIVNSRHLLLSLTLAPYFTTYSLNKNIGIGALVTDESFGVTATRISQIMIVG